MSPSCGTHVTLPATRGAYCATDAFNFRLISTNMHLGSKHEPEASFSFQINDAVKGDEEYLLADDDFLRDVNDYTLTTPAPPSRTSVLDHDQPLTLDHLTTATDGHADAAASLPNSFAPSSPTGASVVHHHEAAVNKRLKTPKRTFAFPSKPSTPKTTRVTRSASKWPSPLREMQLPRPEASPAVAKLTSLRAEIEMLGENDGISSDRAQQQQDGLNSDRRAESGNRSPLNSNMLTPTQLESALPIIEEALTDKDEPYSSPLVTQSAPPDEPSVFSSSGPCDHRDEPASSYADENVENTPKLQEFTGSQNLIGGAIDNKNEALKITPTVTENESIRAPLTISQLSPRKRGLTLDSAELDPVPGSCSATTFASPMRPPRKRPVSAVEKDARQEPNKKGKTLPRTARHQTTAAKRQDAVNLSRSTRRRIVTPKADGKSEGSVVRRRVNSASRLRSSRLSSSGGALVPSTSLASSSNQGQSQRTTRARTASQVGGDGGAAWKRDRVRPPAKRVAEVRFDADDGAEDESCTDIEEDGTPVRLLSSSDVVEMNPEPSRERMVQPSVAPQPQAGKCSVIARPSCNDDDTDHLTQEGANRTKANDFKFEFGPRERKQVDPNEEKGVPGRLLRSRTRSFQASRSALASSSLALSGSRSIGAMTRSRFQYAHHKPVPDYTSQHTLLESSRARRKENIAPVVPMAFELHTDARARERERFDAMAKERERGMEREREAKRREREEKDEREVREMRRRAVPKAHVVPDWYKKAPRRKGRVGQSQDGDG
ncbi:hypothetical protein APHAL10511_005091 [Amanita phalloides]|nr:hypothetical protein APHAL10511_005091 [Amanita phalloides]